MISSQPGTSEPSDGTTTKEALRGRKNGASSMGCMRRLECCAVPASELRPRALVPVWRSADGEVACGVCDMGGGEVSSGYGGVPTISHTEL